MWRAASRLCRSWLFPCPARHSGRSEKSLGDLGRCRWEISRCARNDGRAARVRCLVGAGGRFLAALEMTGRAARVRCLDVAGGRFLAALGMAAGCPAVHCSLLTVHCTLYFVSLSPRNTARLMLNIYRASAGSGKTYRLTQDYIHLLLDPPPRAHLPPHPGRDLHQQGHRGNEVAHTEGTARPRQG